MMTRTKDTVMCLYFVTKSMLKRVEQYKSFIALGNGRDVVNFVMLNSAEHETYIAHTTFIAFNISEVIFIMLINFNC